MTGNMIRSSPLSVCELCQSFIPEDEERRSFQKAVSCGRDMLMETFESDNTEKLAFNLVAVPESG